MRKSIYILVCFALLATLASAAYAAARGDYTTIVYHTGSQIIAEDAAGIVITTGTYQTDDDATVIQAALDRGGRVFLVSGSYFIRTTLSISQNYTTLFGEGGSTVVNLNSSGDCNVIEIYNHNNVTLQDFKICGNKGSNTTGNGIYIHGNTAGTWLNRINRVEVLSCPENGIFIDGDSVYAPQTHMVSNLASEGNVGAGIKVSRLEKSFFNNLYLEGNARGLDISGIDECSFDNIEACSPIGIHIESTSDIWLSHVIVGASAGSTDCKGIEIESTAARIAITDFKAIYDGADTYAIYSKGSYITCRNGHITGGGATYGGVQAGIHVENCPLIVDSFIFNSCARGIEATYGNRHIIKNNTFNGCATPLYGINASNCWINGNYGYTAEASGSSTGTGAQQTIAHGLAATPINVSIVPTASSTTVSGIWADATNIYVTVTSGKTYNWSASISK